MTCVSELCANAITHTASGRGGVFTVEVDRPRDGVARVAVTDDGGASVPAAGAVDLMAEGGRGLAMVAACTSRWGFREAYPGRTVWAEATWPVAVPSPRPREDGQRRGPSVRPLARRPRRITAGSAASGGAHWHRTSAAKAPCGRCAASSWLPRRGAGPGAVSAPRLLGRGTMGHRLRQPNPRTIRPRSSKSGYSRHDEARDR